MRLRRTRGNRARGNRVGRIANVSNMPANMGLDETRSMPSRPRVYQTSQQQQQSLQQQPLQQQQPVRGNQVGSPQTSANQPPVNKATASELAGVYTSPEAEQRLLNRGQQFRSQPTGVDLPSQSKPVNSASPLNQSVQTRIQNSNKYSVDPRVTQTQLNLGSYGPGGYGGSPPGISLPPQVQPLPSNGRQGFGDPIPLRTQSEFTPDPDAIQLRLDLGEANAPITMEQLRQRRQDFRATQGGDRIAGMIQTPEGPVVFNTYDSQAPRSEWVQTNSGPMLVDTDKLRTIYKAGNQVKSGLIEQDALPIAETRPGLLNNITTGLKTGFNVFTGIEPGDNTHFSHSVFQLLNPKFRQRYNDALEANQLNLAGKAAAAAGAVAGDMAKFGTISRLLWRSNAMDLADTYAVPYATTVAGADPQNRPDFKRYAIPLALGTGVVTHIASGNLNPFKVFNTEEGPRVDGYRAEYSAYDTPTQTDNYALALYNQVLPGGGARLLPWEEFHQERPDVSYDQYQNYQNYLWGERGFQLLGGGIKATNESIDAPEDAWMIDPRRYEVRAGGYRITPIGLAAGLGALALGGLAIRRKVMADRIRQLMNQGLTEQQAKTAIAHQRKPVYKVPENIEIL